MRHRVLLTGSTGFVGSAVLAVLLRRAAVDVRVLLRPGRAVSPRAAVTVVRGDLAEPATLAGACAEVDVVIHAASYVGPDARRCAVVNDLGTAALARAATEAGVRRLVYVSTASVYGPGPHRGATEGALPTAPASPTSASRLAAEGWVGSAGGLVLRPHLVYGAGDRWVLPGLAALLAGPGLIENGDALMSMIGVPDLARVTVALALDRIGAPTAPVYHANHPRPIRLGDALAALAGRLEVALPRGTLSRAAARTLLPHLPDRLIELAAVDHWYDSTAVWRDAGIPPGPPVERDLADGAGGDPRQ
ncbi:NAD(P)-dependent oxidoreductase [Micromonospora sp. WMMC241]|uniref:NAD-dependent epimerase/dehydratase family protein n=1 Tax=Micromonospora sp. WMMC241 TaxID=3015159 RepID=UPI0022B6737D|nr:NAD(P)-dependent oxidoreductase [Micromonospora sp. WMMC241]MCZ7440051.1 NAD(P)-dependent oxidoreductase [Micromonospora sp. WMMC241]